MDLYQLCSYDAPGVKTGPAPGVTSLKHIATKKENFKNLLLLNWRVQSFEIRMPKTLRQILETRRELKSKYILFVLTTESRVLVPFLGRMHFENIEK